MPYYPGIHVRSSHNSNNIWREIQIMKLYIMQFHSLSYYFQMQKSTYWTALFPYLVYSLSLKSHTKFHTPAWVNMHTFVSQGHVFREQSKIIRSLLQIHFLSISWFCNLYFLLPLIIFQKFPTLSKCPTLNYLVLGNDFSSANPVIKRCHTVCVLYRTNFRLPSNTALNFYSPYVVTRYYSITTKEINLLCANLIQFIYVPVSN